MLARCKSNLILWGTLHLNWLSHSRQDRLVFVEEFNVFIFDWTDALLHEQRVHCVANVLKKGSYSGCSPAHVNQQLTINAANTFCNRAIELVHKGDCFFVFNAVVELETDEWVFYWLLLVAPVSSLILTLSSENLLEQWVLLRLIIDLEVIDLKLYVVLFLRWLILTGEFYTLPSQ